MNVDSHCRNIFCPDDDGDDDDEKKGEVMRVIKMMRNGPHSGEGCEGFDLYLDHRIRGLHTI